MSALAQLEPGVLSGEDAVRSHDRERVFRARGGGRRWTLLWLLVGPGVLAMLGENDGPSMLSYATSGAQYGIGFFVPFILVTFVMAYVCQEMAMRLGAVTHRGYGELVLQRYGRLWGWFNAGDLVLTNFVTLIAEFVAIRVGLSYFHIGAKLAAVVGIGLVIVALAGGRYWRWERMVLALAAFNALFAVAALLAGPPWGSIGDAVATLGPFPTGSLNTLLLLIASTIGATVTPWMIFFQGSASADKGMTPRDLRSGRIDTLAGALLAAAFAIGALIVGATLFGRPGSTIGSLGGAGFPLALEGSTGSAVATLFALGLVEAGAVAILTISASTAYAIGECLGRTHSFNARPREAVVFYGVNVGVAFGAAALVLIPGAPLLRIALNANVLATVLLPVALVFMLMLASDRELMGPFVNRRSKNLVAVAIIAVVGLSGATYGVDSFLQAVHLI